MVLSLLLAIAAALRLAGLGDAALWYDESGSVWMATLPFDRMIAATGGDTHPPLYFAILWLWVRIGGTSEFWVRVPSLLFSLAIIPLAWRLAKRLNLPYSATLAGAGLVTVSTAQIHYAQEARMYSLLAVMVLIGLFAALDQRWWLFGLALAALCWTHNYGLLYGVVLNAVALWQSRRWSWGLVLANAIAFVSFTPWLAVLAVQMREVAAGYWIQPVTPGSVLYSLYIVVWGYAMPDTMDAHAALLLYAALAWTISRAVLQRNSMALGLLGIALAPVALAGIVSVLWRPILLPRGLFPSNVPLLLAMAWAFTDGVSVQRRLTVGIVIAPVLAVALLSHWLYNGQNKGQPQEIVGQIAWRHGDIVYHANEGSYNTLHFYSPELWPQYMLPDSDWRNPGSYSPVTRAAMGFHLAALADLQWRRAWLVWGGGPTTSATEDEAIRHILHTYPHQLISEKKDEMTHQAIYLLTNEPAPVLCCGLGSRR